ncbi:MAG TPA: Tol-Pal system beta propeller repeat protein TolB, partial [Thermodesulfobacteriota bacterium]|nr:Tol-Pal system beta propeller repeat protein TolB [Thermodesulfobacteriota bacterium]
MMPNFTNKKRLLVLGIFFWVGILIVGRPASLFSRATIDIDSPTAKKISIVIPDLINLGSGESALGGILSQLLTRDLDYTGFFQTVDPKAFLGKDEEKNPDFRAWGLTGAELLVKGNYQATGSGFQADFRLYDVQQGRLLLGKQYSGGGGDHKKMVHRFADEILFLLTGEYGFFQSQIAFVSTTSGKKEMYLADFDGSNFNRLTHHNSISLSPRWSPTGQEIAYTSYKDGNPSLYLLRLPGGQSQRISNRPGLNISPAWFPGGESLALALSQSGGNSEIYQISRDGNILQRLTHGAAIDVSPAWSPDGKQMAFVSNRSGNPQIYVMQVATKETRRVTFQGNYNVNPVWSPKGDRIAYASMSGNRFDIYTLAVINGEAQRLTFGGNNESPDFSPDGRMIIFSSTRHGKS